MNKKNFFGTRGTAFFLRIASVKKVQIFPVKHKTQALGSNFKKNQPRDVP